MELSLTFSCEPTVTLIAEKMGRSTGYIQQRLDLTTLPESIQQAMDSGEITWAVLEVMKKLPDEKLQQQALKLTQKGYDDADKLHARMQQSMISAGVRNQQPQAKVVTPEELQKAIFVFFQVLDGFQKGPSILHPQMKRTLYNQLLQLKETAEVTVSELSGPESQTWIGELVPLIEAIDLQQLKSGAFEQKKSADLLSTLIAGINQALVKLQP